MYKAIFIDIDGTLRNSKRELTKKTKDVIKKVTDAGILVIICSGRPRKYTEDISRECNASKYIITSNGGNIYDYEKNETMYINIMNKQACLELYEIAQKTNVRYIMHIGERIVVNIVKNFYSMEEELKTDIREFLRENDVVQCTLSDLDFDNMKKTKLLIEKVENVEIKNQHKSLLNKNSPKEGTIYCDIANIESSKGNAIKEFCKIMNIDLKDTIAIGDKYNDISMFEVVGNSVAMGNADKEVKENAKQIIKTNDEDGVAVFLETLLTNKN